LQGLNKFYKYGGFVINSKGKLIILALIMCVFISLSAVSAADNNTDDVISISNSNTNVEIQQTAVESTSVENVTSTDETVMVSANGENKTNESNDENVILTDEDLKERGIVLKEPLLGVSIGDEDLLGDTWTYSWGTDTVSWNYVSVHLSCEVTSTNGNLKSISESPGYFKIGTKKSTTSYAGVSIKDGKGYWTWNLYMNNAGLTPGQKNYHYLLLSLEL
jgi:hypothetical protein